MLMTRYFPNLPIWDFANEAERIFNLVSNPAERNYCSFCPIVDIEEQEDAYKVMVELPGVSKNDISINLKDNVLTITGEKKPAKKTDQQKIHQSERVYGKFQRCFRLPDLVDQEKVSAEFDNGVLNIVIPKLAEAQPKEIEVKVK
jgi:HSP20 family protein